MGYYTDFEIIVKPALYSHTDVEAFRKAFSHTTGYVLDDDFRVLYAKWVAHHKDMRALSAQYPDWSFTVDGVGEDGGDIWRIYYKNGKSQDANARLVFDDFDEGKLQ
jgi:hypothetical protein